MQTDNLDELSGYRIYHNKEHAILHERRLALRLKQKEVAERAKIPFQSYQKFESGERKIRSASFDIACRVLTALELDITAFFNHDYALGEKVYFSPEGTRFMRTGRLTTEDPDNCPE